MITNEQNVGCNLLLDDWAAARTRGDNDLGVMGHVEQRIVGVERRTQVVISGELMTMMMTEHDDVVPWSPQHHRSSVAANDVNVRTESVLSVRFSDRFSFANG